MTTADVEQWRDLRLRLDALTQKVEMLSAHVEPPESQPDLEVTIKSLHNTIEGLRNQLDDARQTERDLDAEVAKLARENARLTKLAWEAQKKVEDLEADNKALRATSSEIAAMYEDRLESIRAAADSLVALLERLGFNVFRPGQDICGND
ncbi:MAG: hypothetical protein ACO28P_05355 [Ilumatobacteraceae bacterium]